MENVNGTELYEKCKKNPTGLHEFEAQQHMRQILQSVNYMHCKGYVHRDIKPENLMIEQSDNSIKLIDFGLSIFLPEGEKLMDR
jgi:serine/threonine protein kinase